MKKIKIVLLFVLAVVLAASCKSKSEIYSKPETVTEKFVKAFATADFETMYKCTVPRNAALIREIQKSMRDNPERLKQLNESKVEVQEVKCKMMNDTLARCTCKYSYNQNKRTSEYRVKKMDGKWLVDMTDN